MISFNSLYWIPSRCANKPSQRHVEAFQFFVLDSMFKRCMELGENGNKLSILCIGFGVKDSATFTAYSSMLSILCIGFVGCGWLHGSGCCCYCLSILCIGFSWHRGNVVSNEEILSILCIGFSFVIDIRGGWNYISFNSLYWILEAYHVKWQFSNCNFQFFVLDSIYGIIQLGLWLRDSLSILCIGFKRLDQRRERS